MSPKVKICGICNPADAVSAITAGADYIGLIFVEQTGRYVSFAQAEQIASASKGKCKLVGVFQDAKPAFIEEAIRLFALDMVQLHGGEAPEYCERISVPVIKVITIHPTDTIANNRGGTAPPCPNQMERLQAEISRYEQHCRYLLFDGTKAGGSSNNVESLIPVIARLSTNLDYFVAGGLTTANLSCALDALCPFGLDVASGVESAPRNKDFQKMQTFCDMVRRYKSHESRLNASVQSREGASTCAVRPNGGGAEEADSAAGALKT